MRQDNVQLSNDYFYLLTYIFINQRKKEEEEKYVTNLCVDR